MTGHDSGSDVSRRSYIKASAMAAGVGLTGTAGCLDSLSEGGSDGTLEVLHGWTGGDGKSAVEALIDGFEEAHPDVETDFRPIGGGGNENLDAVVSQRFGNEDPPSTFAGWPGANLRKYEGVLGDVEESVWEEGDLKGGHVEEAAELCQFEGGYSAVPIGSHRLNCLFYNVGVVEDAGVDPDSLTSVDDLLQAMQEVQDNTDAVPMAQAMKAPWTTLQLVAAVMLGQEGYDAYMNYVEGEGDEGVVRRTLETTKEILENHINADASSIGLTESNEKIMNGDAAFIHQGNWAAGAYKGNDLTYDEDWGFTTFPGTEDMYTLHIDSFIYPGDNPSPEATQAFMRYVGGKEAQTLFNSRKGSIPTRDDMSGDDFGPYLAETMEDFASASQKPPTLAHGLAVGPTTMNDLKGVISNDFSGPYDVDAATEGLLDNV